MKKRVLLSFFAAACIPALSFGQDKKLTYFEPFNFESLRAMSMGGRHAAVADGIYTIFNNPALLNDSQDQRYIEITPKMFGALNVLPSFLDAIISGSSYEEESITAAAEEYDGLPTGFDLQGPVSIGEVSKGRGHGIFTRIATDSHVNKKISTTNLDIDVIGALGRAFMLKDTDRVSIDFGITAKVFARYVSNLFNVDIGDYQESHYLLRDMSEKLIAGAGLDFGISFSVNDAFTFSISANDVPSIGYILPNQTSTVNEVINDAYEIPTVISTTDPSASIGFSLHGTHLNDKGLQSAVYSWIFAFDLHDIPGIYYDISDYGYNLLTVLGHITMGLEYTFFRTFSLRLGFANLIPTAGIGMNWGAFELDLAGTLKNTKVVPWQAVTLLAGAALLFRF